MIKRAILSTSLFIALGAGALLMANAGGKDVQDHEQRAAIEAHLQLRSASR